ncbi:MAG: dTMP kinase [Spirochaetaceae bacterium]|nr:dTMP kinase [Spirochaetaceae bacterium]|tara:strand:- start:16890 stop:17588 length:699 start_codon:yes stop_codon:yes gene_type:complete
MGGEFTVARPAVKWKPMAAIKKEESAGSGRAGLFIVLEGIDGSGKTTAWEFLREALASDADVIFLREPTNLPTGQRLRACLQGKSPAPETDDGWMELFLADRRANVTENVIPALSQGKVIVQDRYIYSTAAYQSDNTDRAVELLELQKEFPGPDGIIFLDLTPEQALQRIDSRSGSEGREHFETLDRLERIYANYQSILPENCHRVDAMKPALSVGQELLDMIQSLRSRMNV